MNNHPNFRFGFKGRAVLVIAAVFCAMPALNGCDKTTTPPGNGQLRSELLAEGEVLFNRCTGCHGTEGEGHLPSTPPILHSDFLLAERLRPVRILLLGLPNVIDTATTITVNGLNFTNSQMPRIMDITGSGPWTNREIAAVLTYVRAILNDSISSNCVVDTLNDNFSTSCDLSPRPGAATDLIAPDEVKAIRDSLTGAGILDESW